MTVPMLRPLRLVFWTLAFFIALTMLLLPMSSSAAQPVKAPKISTLNAGGPDTLQINGQNFERVTQVLLVESDGDTIVYNLPTSLVTLIAKRITLRDPRLGNSTVALAVVRDPQRMDVALDPTSITSSVHLTGASATAANALTISGSGFAVVDRIKVNTSTGPITLDLNVAGITASRTDTQLQLRSSALSGKLVTSIEALVAGDGPRDFVARRTVSFLMPTAVPMPPGAISQPLLTGSAQIDGVLTTSTGSWTNAAGITYAYEWRRCDAAGADCITINGAHEITYTITEADAGRRLQSVVLGTTAGGTTRVASVATGVIAALNPPNPTTSPQITGILMVEQTLTVVAGEYVSDRPIESITYAWQRCPSEISSDCTMLAAGTPESYTLTAADAGQYIRVTATATSTVGSGYSAVIVGPVQALPAPDPYARPVISGIAKAGESVSTTDGAWRGVGPITFSYEWSVCTQVSGSNCTVINGSSSTLVIPDEAAGAYVQVVVTGTSRAGVGRVSSERFGLIEARPSDLTPPSTFVVSSTSGQSLSTITTGVAEPECATLANADTAQHSVRWTAATDDTGITAYEVALDGHLITTVTNPDSRVFNYSGPAPGGHVWTITAVSGGGARTSVDRAFRLDTAPPSVVASSATTDVGGTTFTWVANDDNCVARVSIRIDGVFQPLVMSGTETSYITHLEPGVHQWQVYVVDGYGRSAFTQPTEFTVA